jgi:hypothetical protein
MCSYASWSSPPLPPRPPLSAHQPPFTVAIPRTNPAHCDQKSFFRVADGAPRVLDPELSQMVVEVFVHENRPLLRLHWAKEAVRVRRAAAWPTRREPIDEVGQSRALCDKIPLVRHDERRHRRRIALHRLVVAQCEGLDDSAEHPTDQHLRRMRIAERHLHARRAMRERLRGRHLAPLPRTVGPQALEPRLYILRRCYVEKILEPSCRCRHGPRLERR